MKALTLKQIFNRVKKHLLKQKKKAMIGDIHCAYRGEGGTSCAVGCLIKNKYYDKAIETTPVTWLTTNPFASKVQLLRESLEKSGIECSEKNLGLLEDLQRTHDHYDPDEWPKTLTIIEQKIKNKDYETNV